jgi:glycosyltransferase involved in cell wall biosynthesis
MRILLSAFACNPNVGSEPGVGWNWAVEIARLGHEVLVLTQGINQPAIEAAQASGALPSRLRFVYLDRDWLVRLQRRGLPLQICHLVWQFLAWRRARRLVADEHFDLVHHITYAGIRQASFLGRLPVPFVLGPVGGGERGPYALRRGLGARAWTLELIRDGLNVIARVDPMTQQALSAARLIFVSNPDTARLVPARHQAKVRVELQIGIHPPAAPTHGRTFEERSDGPLRLLFAGRCLAWKGMDLGLEALAELLGRGCWARLTIVGSGSAEGLWRAQAQALGLEEAVDWLARVEHARMADVYRAHDVLLFPSLHDSGGQVVLEALAYGRPVVCLDLGGPGRIVNRSCGRVIATAGRSRAQVVHDLADALQELATSAPLRQRLGAGAQERARDFAWDKLVGGVYAEIGRALRADSPVSLQPLRA